MRFKGRDNTARAIYFATSGRRLVVVRALVKKLQKTPRGEIDLADRRMKEFRVDQQAPQAASRRVSG